MASKTRLLVSAVAAAVLFSIGYALVVVIPGGGEVTTEDFTDFYEADRSMATPFMLVLALLAGAWSLVWFFSELRSRLVTEMLTTVGYGTALIGAAGLAIGGALLFAPAAVQMNSDSDFVGVEIAHTFAQAGLGTMLMVGMLSMAVATILFSIALKRSNLVPSWLGIVGIVFGVLMVASYVWVPGYLLPIWVLAVGIIGVEGRERAGEGSRAAT
jgi:hypothetical protein